MKIRLLLAVAVFAIGLAVPTFAQQKDTVDPQTAQQIRALASNYDAAFNRNDAAAVSSLYTEDAVFKTPNGTFNGREAIEGLYRKLYIEGDHAKNDVTIVDEIIAVGNEVRVTGKWSDTFEEIEIIHADGTSSPKRQLQYAQFFCRPCGVLLFSISSKNA